MFNTDLKELSTKLGKDQEKLKSKFITKVTSVLKSRQVDAEFMAQAVVELKKEEELIQADVELAKKLLEENK